MRSVGDAERTREPPGELGEAFPAAGDRFIRR